MGTDRNGTGLAGLGGMANCRRCRTRLGCVIPLRLIYWTSTPGGDRTYLTLHWADNENLWGTGRCYWPGITGQRTKVPTLP